MSTPQDQNSPRVHACHGTPDNTHRIADGQRPDANLIRRKVRHGPGIVEFVVHVPALAAVCRPGQFLIVRGDERGERIPLTIADFDREKGEVTMVVHVVGLASHKLDELKEGDRIRDIVGPLGHPSEIENFGRVVLVAGGLGIAPVYPIQRALKEAGNRVVSIMGARNVELLFWREKMSACADQTVVCTDDGSVGEKGLVTAPLKRLLEEAKDGRAEPVARVIAVGPPVMMKFVAETTRPFGVKTVASLNAIMVDGTGMCGGCRVAVDGKTRFVCVDGPEFDAHQVDFDLLLSRLGAYRGEEADAYGRHREIVAAQTRGPNAPAAARVPMPAQDPRARRGNFDEVATGYTPELARAEALRCRRCKNPRCVEGCPVAVRIPEFIERIQQGDPLGAAAVIKQTNNLPAICGRVCPQETQCEARCILANTPGGAVAVGRLERFAADAEAEARGRMLAREIIDPTIRGTEAAIAANPDPAAAGLAAPGAVDSSAGRPGAGSGLSASGPAKAGVAGRAVAVIGSGPAGLAAAADLARAGAAPVIFEALHSPGGVLAYGIPEFRLPKAIVSREVGELERLGVRFRMNMPIGPAGTVEQLLREGFDAVFLGTGAGLPLFLDIPGENSKNVYSANEFLTRINLMKAYRFPEYDTPVNVGRRVAVIGGGNVAMDAARCAVRLGADGVDIVYRRTRAELPARREEVEHAEEEGVRLLELLAPVSVKSDAHGWVSGLELRRCELGEPDARGRRRPVEIPGSETVFPYDQVVVAIGNGPNPILTRNFPELKLDGRGNIPVDDDLRTNVPGVFAGGDIVTGAATVIEAMGAGKRAAAAIIRYLEAGSR